MHNVRNKVAVYRNFSLRCTVLEKYDIKYRKEYSLNIITINYNLLQKFDPILRDHLNDDSIDNAESFDQHVLHIRQIVNKLNEEMDRDREALDFIEKLKRIKDSKYFADLKKMLQ